ncbi:signal recognition particle-docking protein FtsY [Paraglaciecola sp. L3A3]|uniref:signal recognition particle-docking protein FtsY n=1 Tax=Paraglaciecola sp. L3A3 TaxID=2686358 RepID=UPI00131CA288|nr:signal recognition particle-docking protein FtsY [Paraglaciecola sp. L3A3]
MSKFFNWLKKNKDQEVPSPSDQEALSTGNEQPEQTANTIKNDDSELQKKPEEINNNNELAEEHAETFEQVINADDKLEPTLETNHSYNEDTINTPTITTENKIAVEAELSEITEVVEQVEPVEQAVVAEEIVETAPIVEKTSFFGKLKRSLSRTKESIGSGIIGIFRGKAIDDELFEELETQLLVADLGMNTTVKLIKQLTESSNRKQLKDGEALYQLLKEQMAEILNKVDSPLVLESPSGPFVILMVGVNGVGKTTTIGKMAKQFQQQGKKVMLAAGDTFRAAAVEQLQVWGERNDIPVVAQQTGSDSASVIFDAFQSAKAKNIDVLIADTAGRLQNKDHLMEELKKVVRVMRKISPEAPHEIMLTLDASTGQNAVSQTKLFHEAVGLTGISLTKLDGTAKGGVIFSIADEFNIPIRYVGIGEGIDDLRPFNGKDFVDALFTETDNQTDQVS